MRKLEDKKIDGEDEEGECNAGMEKKYQKKGIRRRERKSCRVKHK
jgi:hypothetical protein